LNFPFILCVDYLGTNFVIQWTPSGGNGTVSLDLGSGDSANIQIDLPIVSGIPNSGV